MASSSWGPGSTRHEVNVDMEAWAEHVLSLAAERYERRLAEEISGMRLDLKQEMHDGFAAVGKEVSELRAELLKWSFAFWIGQFAATIAVLGLMLRR